jgi:hypothetical protein
MAVAAFAGILLFKALSNNVILGRNSMVLGTLVVLRTALAVSLFSSQVTVISMRTESLGPVSRANKPPKLSITLDYLQYYEANCCEAPVCGNGIKE